MCVTAGSADGQQRWLLANRRGLTGTGRCPTLGSSSGPSSPSERFLMARGGGRLILMLWCMQLFFCPVIFLRSTDVCTYAEHPIAVTRKTKIAESTRSGVLCFRSARPDSSLAGYVMSLNFAVNRPRTPLCLSFFRSAHPSLRPLHPTVHRFPAATGRSRCQGYSVHAPRKVCPDGPSAAPVLLPERAGRKSD